MTKYTQIELRTHRDDIINIYYPIGEIGSGDGAVLAIYGHDDNSIAVRAYPSVTDDGNSIRLNDEQVDIFMQSTEFDKPLFRTLIVSLDLDVDIALIASLS